MVWLFASMPLWILGLSFLVLGVYGMLLVIKGKDSTEMMAASFIFLILAAVFLPLAAKVAS